MSQYKEEVKRAAELADSGRPDEAVAILKTVLTDDPDHYAALYTMAATSLQAARHADTFQLAKRLVELKPKVSFGWELLTLCYGETHKYDESLAMAKKALACKRETKTLANMAYALINIGEWAEGRKYAEEAIALSGGDEKRDVEALTEASVHRVYCLLANSEWKEGFERYRLTMRTKWRKEYKYTMVAPDGSSYETEEWFGEPDAVVMTTGEQGLGDEIMAASVVPDAVRRAKKFVLDCDHRLAPLFRRSFPNAIVTGTRRDKQLSIPVRLTHHKTMFSLSEIFRQKDEDFPRTPYLVPREDYVAMFKTLLGKPTIGIAWSGGLPRTGQSTRAAGLNAFLPLIRRGEAQFLSLQYKDDEREVALFEHEHKCKVMRLPWVTQGQDMDLLAGLLAALQEVIGVHTSALHLASALGAPTTVLTHRGSGWRYAPKELLWYPTTTKMHKKKAGESWRECVNRLVEERK